MGFSKSNMAGWGPKFKDHPKMAFVPAIYHIGPYENACKSEKVEKVPPLILFSLDNSTKFYRILKVKDIIY